MNILLFGKDGQVGWELNRLVQPLGEVTAMGRLEADFSEPEALRKIVQSYRPDVIINAAAYTAVDRAEEEEALAMLVNSEAPGVLAEEARKINALLIHYSTDYVFDGENEKPYAESDEPNPINVYGNSKLGGERAIQNSGCRYIILRTSWVYSSRGKNFFLTVVRLAEKQPRLAIVSDQTGAPTWARMIADATIAVLKQACGEVLSGSFVSDVYHLTSRGQTTWYGFATKILSDNRITSVLKGRQPPGIDPLTTAQYPTPARRPKNSTLDISKIESRYDLQLPDWEKSLGEFMQTVVPG